MTHPSTDKNLKQKPTDSDTSSAVLNDAALGPSIQQVEYALRQKNLERLGMRLRKMRLLLAERNWELLRTECSQLSQLPIDSSLQSVKTLAQQAEELIPPGRVARASALPDARQAIEALLNSIDILLTEDQIARERELKRL